MNANKIFIAALILSSGCSKKNSPEAEVLPAATINSVAADRTINSTVFLFSVSLNKASTNAVTIHYKTADGSALQNTDYIPVDGTLTIDANKTEGFIQVTVKGDSLRRTDQEFFVLLDNPQNCTLLNNKGTGTIINSNGTHFPVDNAGYTTPTSYPGYSLVWSDEFSSKVINEAYWTFESGNNNGWGNNELQYYTDRPQNVFASQGNLIIEAKAESYNGKNYTSTRMITKDKKIFKYGRVDIRAKMPKGKGIWPALWMLGNNITQVNWPACGEIDILELLGHEPNKIYGTVHWGPSAAAHYSLGKSYTLNTGSFDQQFYVYSLIWKPDEIKVLVNDQVFVTVAATDITGTNPFNSNFFFIFNIAVGGNWPGSPDNTTVFPQRMVVDYIRVFQ